MPLPPATRRARYKYNHPKPEAGKFPKKRCKNCPKFFELTRDDKLFCSDQCRKEFHRFGSSYGTFKDKLEKLVRKWSNEERAKLNAEIKELKQRVSILEQQAETP